MISATAAIAQTSASIPWMSSACLTNERSLEAHEPLVHEGDDTCYFYEVLEGVVSSYKIFADGRRQIISFAFPGDLIGFSHGDAYRYDCEAISPSRVRAIPKTSLLRSIRERPEIGEKLLALAALEVAHVENHSINLGRKSAIERIASFLVSLVERAGYSDANSVTMQLPMTRLDMADLLGLTIETVSRSLTKLRARNIIELPQTTTLVVKNMNRLRDLAECDAELC
jgi:CRP-like cAMP-binding protein